MGFGTYLWISASESWVYLVIWGHLGISDGSEVTDLMSLFYSAGLHAIRPAQTVPGEQLTDDGAVWSQRFNCEHHAGVNKGGLAALPVGWGDGGMQFPDFFLIVEGSMCHIKYGKY